MPVEAWGAYHPSNVLWIVDFETYDAGTVSPSTATGVLYPTRQDSRSGPARARPALPPPPGSSTGSGRPSAPALQSAGREAYVHWTRRFSFVHDK